MAGSAGQFSLARSAHQLAHLLAHFILVSSALCIAFWLLYAGTRSYHLYHSGGAYWEPHVFEPTPACAANTYALSPIFNTCQEERVLFSHLLFLWLLPAVMALSAVVLLATRAQAQNQAPKGVDVKCTSRLAAPRSFWMRWCGGLTVGDMLIIIVWLVMNALWLYAIITRNKSLQAVKLARRGWSHNASTKAKLLGKSLGMLLYPNLVLLFLPVSRGSVILQATGIPYPAAIKYHRWLGHAVLWIVAIHSMLYYAAWLHEGQWLTEVVEQEPNVNKLMGSISFAFALVLWISSMEVFRRRHYSVFKAFHHICFWGFLLFGCAHSWSMVWYFLPGLMLAGVDAGYRITQAAVNSSKHGNVQVLHATASPDGTLASLVIAAEHFAVPSSGFIWLCVPGISKVEWHPFTYIAVPWEVPGGSTSGTHCSTAVPQESASSTCTAMLVQIKAYNKWSKKLVELVSSSATFTLKVQGPYAETPEAVQGHGWELVSAAGSGGFDNKESEVHPLLKAKGVIIVAGGLGIAPAMSLFQELQLSSAAALPLLFVWSCRKAEELQFLAPRVMAMLQTLSPRQALLTTELYITGAVPTMPGVTNKKDNTTTSSDAASVPNTSGAGAASSGARPSKLTASAENTHSGSKASMVTTNLGPVLNFGSYYAQAAYHFLVHAVVFGAALVGILLARYVTTSLPSQPWPTDKMGAVYVIMVAAFTIIPGTLLSLIAHKLLKATAIAPKTATVTADNTITELELEKTAHGGPATTWTAASAAAASVAAGIPGRLECSQPTVSNSPVFMNSSGDPCNQPKAMLQLHLPVAVLGLAKHAASSHSKQEMVLPVKLGRPPLEQIVSSWIAGVQHLPAADAATLDQFVVHAMGPEKLVQDVQLLCDAMNRRSTRCSACRKPGSSPASVQTYLHFVRRSHDL